jgi:hypothetical protein
MLIATDATIFHFASRKERKRKQKNLKELSLRVNDQYFADLEYGVRKNYPTFIIFVPPGIIEDNHKTVIFIREPDAECPDGSVVFFHEIHFLDKLMPVKLEKDFVSQWSKTKAVNIRSDYTCSFFTDIAA